MDDIGFQEFIQDSLLQWRYVITTKQGKKYTALYQVLKTGFIREIFSEGHVRLIWDREFRAGEALKVTISDVIKNGGKFPVSSNS